MDMAIEAATFRIISIAFIVIGTIGNVLNVFIFKRPALRKSPCTLYLLAASVDNLLVIYTALITRLLANGFGIDVATFSSMTCRLRYYLSYIFLALSPYLFILACFDRYCLSSPLASDRLRSNHRFAKRSILSATLLACLLYSHMVIFYDLEDTPLGLACNCQSGIYEYFYRYFYLFVYCLGPPLIMTYFCILTSTNIHHHSQRIKPSLSKSRENQYRRLDRQLIRMLICQVLTHLICSLPYAILNMLPLFLETNLLILFLQQIFILPLYVTYITSFYIFTLSSRLYRQELCKLLHL